MGRFHNFVGRRVVAYISGASYPVIQSEITADSIVELGGVGERGGFNIDVGVDVFGATRPAKFSTIVSDPATFATLETALTGSNNDITYTAVTPGDAGNAISVVYTDPAAANQALSVTARNNLITVNLATNGASAITSTATLVLAAVQAHARAAQLVSAALSGASGAGVVTAMAETNLAGGSGRALQVLDVRTTNDAVHSITAGDAS